MGRQRVGITSRIDESLLKYYIKEFSFRGVNIVAGIISCQCIICPYVQGLVMP